MQEQDISGRRVAVVGASSGLGRCIALGLGERGATVAMLARRAERLEEALEKLPAGSVAAACDVTDEAGLSAALTGVVRDLGGLDAIVYSAALFPILPLAETDAATWGRVFATNVTGAAVATSAVLDALAASNGIAVYLSSISATVTPSWPFIGAYVASKAALNKMVDAWRVEHPDIGFSSVNVGECAGGEGYSSTEVLRDADPDVVSRAMDLWLKTGALSGSLVSADDLVASVAALLQFGPSSVPARVDLVPRVGIGQPISELRGR